MSVSELGSDSTRLPNHWLILARAIWWGLLLLYGALFVAAIPAQIERLSLPCDPGVCADEGWFLISSAELQALDRLGIAPAVRAAYHVGWELVLAGVTVALALILSLRHAGQRMAYLTSATLLLLGLWATPETPQALFGGETGLLNGLLWLPVGPALAFILFLLPDGRFAPAWSRWFALMLALTFPLAIWLPFFGLMRSDASNLILLVGVALPSLVTGILSQIYRYRRVAGPVERQQIKWVSLGVLATLAGPVTYALLIQLAAIPPGEARLAFDLVGAILVNGFVMLLPVSLALAILRYRLWDVDLIIRRTLIYASLTAALALVYFSSVVILQATVQQLTGQNQSELVTVVSTLTIAALFVPLRARVQGAIDRRFYRKKYDAAQTLAAFGAQARDVVELEQLQGQLVRVVDETMQPAHVTMWLSGTTPGREDGRMIGDGSGADAARSQRIGNGQ